MAPDERRPLRRLAALLGYNPELPRAYAASPLFVIAAAGLAGTASYWRVEMLFGGFAGAAAALPVAALTARFLLRRKTVDTRRSCPAKFPKSWRWYCARCGPACRWRGAAQYRPRNAFAHPRGVLADLRRGNARGADGDAMSNLYARTQIREYAFFAVSWA